MTYRMTFRIRRIHFDAIRNGFKLVEYRRSSAHWNPRGRKAQREVPDVEAVFVCGKEVHRRSVVWVEFGGFEKLSGRHPSPQGRIDLGDGDVWAFFLGVETA